MPIIPKKVEDILATEAFKSLFCSQVAQIGQITAAVALLMKAGIDFNLAFNRGTNSLAAQAELTIFINSITSLSYVFTFEGGSGVFR